MTAIFLITGALYFWLSRKIDQWMTMQLLGEELHCPAAFLTHGWIYRLVSALLLVGFLVAGIASTINTWLASALVIGAWMFAGASGRIAAFNQYRQQAAEDKVLFSGDNYADDPKTPQRIASAEQRMRMTNVELQEQANTAARMGR